MFLSAKLNLRHTLVIIAKLLRLKKNEYFTVLQHQVLSCEATLASQWDQPSRLSLRLSLRLFSPWLISCLPAYPCWINWVRPTQTCGNFWVTSENSTLESKFTSRRLSADKQSVILWPYTPLTVVWGRSLQYLLLTNCRYSIGCQPRPLKDLNLGGKGKRKSLTLLQPLSTWRAEERIRCNPEEEDRGSRFSVSSQILTITHA